MELVNDTARHIDATVRRAGRPSSAAWASAMKASRGSSSARGDAPAAAAAEGRAGLASIMTVARLRASVSALNMLMPCTQGGTEARGATVLCMCRNRAHAAAATLCMCTCRAKLLQLQLQLQRASSGGGCLKR